MKIFVKDAWDKLFDKYEIVEKVAKDGFFIITADQIKEFKEPRLMTKFDEYESLPDVFKKRHLSILSISRTEYMIGMFDLYHAIKYDKKTDPMEIERINLESLDPENLYSESSAILFAFNSLILKNALETDDLSFTLNGRMSSKEFSFNVWLKDSNGKLSDVKEIPIQNSQIEIDAGFETEDKLYILEAKNRHVDEINLRQLYFPYKLWSNKVSKEVVPVFLVYTDSTFYIFTCKFEDPENINSLKILDSRKYVVADAKITMEDIEEIYRNIKPGKYSDATFPQADSFKRIMDLMQILTENDTLTKEDITLYFQFTDRQTDYYVTAARFLGLVSRSRGVVSLTDNGRKIMKKPYKQKHLDIFRLILRDNVFYESYGYLKTHCEPPSKELVTNLISKHHLPEKKLNSDTPKRRAGTVTSWLKWMIDIVE